MARPQKAGLDYFPFDVGLLKDNKLRRPKMTYGYLAIAVYLALLTLLYSDKGYYIPYETQNEKDDAIWYVLDSLQGKYQPDADTIAKVIEELVACGLFSGDRYPKNITSKRSQSVYYSATVDRKSIVIDDAVWLLSLDEMRVLSEKHIYYLSKTSQPNNDVNRSNNDVNRSNNPQSKEKKSKEKNDKESKKDIDKDYDRSVRAHESHADIMTKMCVAPTVRIALEEFLRNSYLNKHIVPNEKLTNIILRLDLVYGKDEAAKVASLKRAISGNYFDIAEKI